jgi:hypothetical protein
VAVSRAKHDRRMIKWQSSRFEPSIRTVHLAIPDDIIGQPLTMTITQKGIYNELD